MNFLSLKRIAVALCVGCALASTVSYAETKSKRPEKKLEIASDNSLGFLVASRNETLKDVKRIGLMPVVLPEPFAARQELKNFIEESIAKKLRDAGYEVVTHESYSNAYDKLNKKLGGVYDPDSGTYKAEQDQAIKAAARREFMEKEHLNALMLSTIRLEKAPFYGSDAYLDGAIECSLGKMPPNAVAEFFLGNPSLSGSLTGYSLLIQLLNTQDKVVFGRFGGIQLANYYDPASTKGVSGFLSVPIEDALRDNQRIERGIAIATLPLVKTPEEIARNKDNKALNPQLLKADDLPPPPQGVANKEPSPFIVPRDTILSTVKKIIVVPVNANRKISVPASTKEQFLSLIEKELKGSPWEIVRGPNIFESMDKEIDSAKGLFDPLTGKYDDARVQAIRKHALASLNLNATTAVLFPTISVTRANYKGNSAYWYGANQDIYTLEPVKKPGLFDGPSGNAESTIAATALFTQLRDSEDKILYQGTGGIELTEQLKGKDVSTLAPGELFQKPERAESAVHFSLRSLLMTPEDLYTELHPNRPKPKTKKDKKSKDTK